MGDVGAVANLANTLASWLLSEKGFATWDRNRRLEALHEAGILAIRENNWIAYDTILAELKRLSEAAP